MSVQTRIGTTLADPVPGQRRAYAVAGFVVLCACLGVYYALLLCNGSLALLGAEQFDRVFGSMLHHLLHGEFTVDRDAIGSESFTRDGRTYSYFGVFPAFLRLLAMPFVDVTQVGLGRVSCLLAMLLFVAIQLRTLILVHAAVPPAWRSGACLGIMIAAISLSGPQLYLLGSAWVYHEPVFWAGAMGAAYNLVVLRVVLAERAFRSGDLVLLAGLAGLALNTRASVGASLCVATGLLVLWVVWSGRRSWRALPGAVADPRLLTPVLVLALFVAAACVVNYGRWGNPFRFADFRYYDFAHRQPWRLAVILDQGELAPSRMWVAVLYYATGIPYVLKGIEPFAGYLRGHFDGLEAPPMSGLIANPLIVILAGLGLYRLFRSKPPGASALRLVLLGHATGIVLVCCAMYLAMRYRMDFAPFMTLAAFIGYPVLSGAIAAGRHRRAVLGGAVALCVLGIASSHYLLVIHKVWSQGVPREVRLQLLPYAPFAHAALEP